MITDPAMDHFGQWVYAAVWVAMFAIFLIFTPFYKKSQRKPASAYLAFIVALAFEMFGIPLSMYVLTWLFGFTLPDGILWGHTLQQYIGLWGVNIGALFMVTGIVLIVLGWHAIHRDYWSKEAGEGKLVTRGIYNYIRHPQYTGFLLITLGMLFDWTTLPLLIMYPILVVIYYRLARKEEADMEAEFGAEYSAYKARTSMFVPLPRMQAAPVH